METCRLLAVVTACIFLVVNTVGCSSTILGAILPRDNTLVTTDEFEGVIFRGGDWVPTVEEIRALENQLNAYLPQHQKAFDGMKKPIEERLPTYKRQYWGVLEDEKKVVFANFFCHAFDYDWMNERVFVLDGGDCYFQIRYDVETESLFDLRVNGSA